MNQDFDKIRQGYYSDKYFLRTQQILLKDNYNHKVHYQYFPRKNKIVICGTKEIHEIFKNCTGYYIQNGWINRYDQIEFYSVDEGTILNSDQPCIGIIGNPKYFAHLETPTLGLLAQQSAIATSVQRIKQVLDKDQKLLFFPARFRHYINQESDGYAAYIGGCDLVSTDANGSSFGAKGIGTVPHLLIASYCGDTVKAALKFDEIIGSEVNRVILVDWDNDCIGTSLKVILGFISRKINKDFGPIHKLSDITIKKLLNENFSYIPDVIGEGRGKLFGIRFDTSASLCDKSTHGSVGVNKELVDCAKNQFMSIGARDLKIIVSGGFDQEKIEFFNHFPQARVDMFGVGSSIYNFRVDFTADAVCLDGMHNAKVGRELMDWNGMQRRI